MQQYLFLAQIVDTVHTERLSFNVFLLVTNDLAGSTCSLKFIDFGQPFLNFGSPFNALIYSLLDFGPPFKFLTIRLILAV